MQGEWKCITASAPAAANGSALQIDFPIIDSESGY
jgi:hypothetical protein